MNVICGEAMVASIKSVRYLGVDLDQSLQGDYIAFAFGIRSNSMSFRLYMLRTV